MSKDSRSFTTLVATPVPPDAELIGLCERLAAIEAEEERIQDQNDDDDECDRLTAASRVEARCVFDRIRAIGAPSTPAGAVAMARAAIATAPRYSDLSPITLGPAEWLAFTIAGFLCGIRAPADWVAPENRHMPLPPMPRARIVGATGA